MEPLIFRRLLVEWDALIPPAGAPRSGWANSWLASFPAPGDIAERGVDGIRLSERGLEFPGWGQWRIFGTFGVVKLLLLDPATGVDDIPRSVLEFVSSNVWHALSDEYLGTARTASSSFVFDRLAEKFFYSDQPLGLHCATASLFLAVVLDRLGYKVRTVSLKSGNAGHVLLEVWLPEAGRWIILDTDFGVMLRHGGTMIGTEEMMQLLDADRIGECEIVDVARKNIPHLALNLSKAFVGQLTWQPVMLNPNNPAAQAYRRNVLGKRFRSTRYAPVSVVTTAAGRTKVEERSPDDEGGRTPPGPPAVTARDPEDREPEATTRQAAIALVREAAHRILRERIDALGVNASGAYGHYTALLDEGALVRPYDLAALDLVLAEVPALASYHEIGSGIGILPFLLALNGVRSVGIERDRRRHETALAIWHDLRGRTPAAENCRLVHGSFASALADLDTLDSIAIFTDFVSTQSDNELAAIHDGLKRYRYVLVDLHRFCVKRDFPDEQRALVRRMNSLGLTCQKEINDPIANDYALALFRNEAHGQANRLAGVWTRVVGMWRERGMAVR